MTDYDVDVRSITPVYKHTIDSQAGREVDSGREVHLETVTVTVKIAWGTSREHRSQTFDVTFRFDHEGQTVCPSSIGDSHSEAKSFGVGKLTTAIEYSERALIAFLEDVGPDYYLKGFTDHINAAAEFGDDVRVHTDLEVEA